MIIIGISGGTASGKSTLSKKIIYFFRDWDIKIDHLELDNYYRDFKKLSIGQRNSMNFDNPNSIDFKLFYQHLNKISQGSNVDTPTYCYKTHLRKKKTYRINKPDVLLVNGLFILLNKKIRDFFDLTIFLDIDSDTRLKRRITRDIRERGGERNLIKNKYKNVIKPMHEKYVEPNKKFANLILDNNTNYKSIYQEIEIKLNKIDKKNKKI